MSLNNLYHEKQQEVLRRAMTQDYFMLINHGAKRSGKTVLDNDLFLYELRRVRANAAAAGISNPQYILAAADIGSIHRNILNELSGKYDLQFQFDKFNRFQLFGVQVCCFGHSKINDMGRIRGMTAWGAYINEACVANEEVFDEIKSRCSGDGARILMDTNPADPAHWLKTDYIDKADGKTIVQYPWRLDDNTFLSERYRQNIKNTTPSGMFYDRDINGAWVSADGAVYPDFDEKVHYISADKVPIDEISRWFVGVDFGWEHWGAFVLIGRTEDGRYYLFREWAAQHRHIDNWIKIGQSIKEQYGNINFYCDSARPDLIQQMRINGLRAINARKDVLAGIAEVASLYKQKRLFIVRENVSRFPHEIYSYVWKKGTDEPVKIDDDVQDAIRYGIYSDKKYGR
ncbi:PBSX family phage terminase large subunit [Ruminococcaceae bacterium BL-4]|nr:PBSX family phage terminase large subunit [Ruminococcaceae bacterium BL-4]